MQWKATLWPQGPVLLSWQLLLSMHRSCVYKDVQMKGGWCGADILLQCSWVLLHCAVPILLHVRCNWYGVPWATGPRVQPSMH